MANIIDNNVTWCGQQATEVLLKPTFFNPGLTFTFDVLGDIKSTRQLALDDNIEDVVRTSSGCGRDVAGGPISIDPKVITLCDLKVNLDQCAKDLKNSFMEEMLRQGNDIFDLTGTDLENYILVKSQNALENDVPKIAWFGDTTLAGSYPTIGACDGVWKRLIAGVSEYDVERGYTFGDTLSDCEALDALRATYEGASDLLDSLPENQKHILVTRSVYNNYLTCLEERCCGDRGTILMEDGRTTLTFRGIPVIKMSQWDRWISNYGLGNPHRLMYTTKTNLVIGTDLFSDTNTLEFWYDRPVQLNHIDAEFSMGTQYKYGELTSIAY